MNKKRLSILIALNFVTSTLLFPTATIFAAGTTPTTVAPPSTYGIQYEGHVQNNGWQKPVITIGDSEIISVNEAGTDGRGLRVEALKLSGTNLPKGTSITYQAHVQNYGWMTPVTTTGNTAIDDAAKAGTNGEGLRVEAFKITLKGLPGYAIKYQTHVQNKGWMDAVETVNETNITQSTEAGTNGLGLRMEAVKIEIVKTEAEKALEVVAIDAVTKAETTKSNTDITAATTAVHAVADTAESALLTNRIAHVNDFVVTSIKAIYDTNVFYGTTLNKVGLPTKIELVISDKSTKNVDVTWTSTNYNGTKAGLYTFIGTYVLPTGVSGTILPITANVIVGSDSGNVNVNPTPDPAIAYSNLKAGVETKVSAYEGLASGDLLIQTKINAANTAKSTIVLDNLTNADKAVFQSRIGIADKKVTAAQKVITDAATADVLTLDELNVALANVSKTTININGNIIIPVGTNEVINRGKTLILNSKLTVESNIEVNGSIVTPSTIKGMTKMGKKIESVSPVSDPKLEIKDHGVMSVKDGSSMKFDSFTDIITPTNNSVILYAGANVSVGGKQYIGDSSDALIKLSNFTNSIQPVAGYFLNGDRKLLLVIFEKAEVLQTEQNVLDIDVLVKAGGVSQSAGELTIPNFNIINPITGGVIIEANGSLTEGNKSIVTKSDTGSVFNATGGDLDNRRGVLFSKSQNNSVHVSIHGDVTMNKAFTASISPEYFPYSDFYKSDLNPSLNIKFNPVIGDFIGNSFGDSIPVEGKYEMINNNSLFVNATSIITGTVKNPDGTPAALGNVSIKAQNGDPVSSGNINNGKFLLGGLADGTYNLVAHPNGDSQYTNSTTKTITITNGVVSPATDANIELAFTNPLIIGTVKNPDGTLANEANVFINSQNGSSGSSVSINNGKFLLGGLADGTYNIAASPYDGSQYTSSMTKIITITNGAVSEADANIELDFTNPLIIGTVKNPDGTPANAGGVSINTQSGEQVDYVNINSGKFIIGALADGTYSIVAYADGNSPYISSIIKTITIFNGVVSPASDANIELAFTNPLITGTVKNPDGTPATSGWVTIDSQSWGQGSSVSIYNGNFFIGALADGTYNIVASPYDGSQYTSSVTKTITITDGAVSEADATMDLKFTNPLITGTVKNPGGTPATSGWVTINSQNGGQGSSGIINNGKFLLGGLADGTYNIVAYPDGDSQYTNSMTKTMIITDGVVSLADANIELKFTNPIITGTVKNPDGTPATSGWVTIYPQNEGQGSSGNISNGKFLLGGLADGTYNIIAYPEGDSKYTNSTTKTIIITNGIASPATDANIELNFTSPIITGTVKNPDGTPANAGNIFIDSKSGGSSSSVSINNGEFLIGALADGTYNIVASPFDGSQYTSSVTKTITIIGGVVSPATDAKIELAFTNPIITGIVKLTTEPIVKVIDLNARSIIETNTKLGAVVLTFDKELNATQVGKVANYKVGDIHQ